MENPPWIKRIRFCQQNSRDDTDITSQGMKYRRIMATYENSYEKEIHRIENEYRTKFEELGARYQIEFDELESWKTDSLRRVYDSFKRKSFMSNETISRINGVIVENPCKNQFCMEKGSTACSAISLVACYNFIKCGNHKKMDFSYIMRTGINIWINWKNETKDDKIQSDYVSVEELLLLREFSNSKADIGRALYLHGRMVIKDEAIAKGWYSPDGKATRIHWMKVDMSKSNIEAISDKLCDIFFIDDFVNYIYSIPYTIAITFTIRSNTISIFTAQPRGESKEREAHLFDSHGTGDGEDEMSLLIHFNSKDSLTEYLITKYPTYQPTSKTWTHEIQCEKYLENTDHNNQFTAIVFCYTKYITD